MKIEISPFPLQQYQDAIRAHKAGRPVNLADLPVPPGNFLQVCFTMTCTLQLQKVVCEFLRVRFSRLSTSSGLRGG